MKLGDLVKGFVPIKWGEKIEEAVYPGLKHVTGIIVNENIPHKKVLVLIDDSTHWWDTQNTEVITSDD